MNLEALFHRTQVIKGSKVYPDNHQPWTAPHWWFKITFVSSLNMIHFQSSSVQCSWVLHHFKWASFWAVFKPDSTVFLTKLKPYFLRMWWTVDMDSYLNSSALKICRGFSYEFLSFWTLIRSLLSTSRFNAWGLPDQAESFTWQSRRSLVLKS